MSEFQISMLSLYVVICLLMMVITLGHVVWQNDEDYFLNLSPLGLYSETEMNWFGCIVAWVFILLINPFWWILVRLLECLINITIKFISWLVCVGRKER